VKWNIKEFEFVPVLDRMGKISSHLVKGIKLFELQYCQTFLFHLSYLLLCLFTSVLASR